MKKNIVVEIHNNYGDNKEKTFGGMIDSARELVLGGQGVVNQDGWASISSFDREKLDSQAINVMSITLHGALVIRVKCDRDVVWAVCTKEGKTTNTKMILWANVLSSEIASMNKSDVADYLLSLA